jgi:monofunctional biosynthetic peptidoglycan transglycosylase
MIVLLALAATMGFDGPDDLVRLYEFDGETAASDWNVINDGVMGGLSASRFDFTENGTAAFVGHVSLENNGGFASARSRPREWKLEGLSGIRLRVLGDGKRYKLNLRTDRALDGVLYRAPFDTRAGQWITIDLPFSEFVPSFRGRVVPDAPTLEPGRVVSLGLLISDRQAGPFRLEIAWIAAYR